MNTMTKELGRRIRAERTAKKMTQEELAEKIGITATHLKHIESEHRKPSIEVLFSLASELHISLDALLLPLSEDSLHQKKTHEILSLLNSCTNDELDIFLAALHELNYKKLKG